jgi:hypothetical protein
MHRILDFGSRNLDCSGMSRRKSILSKLAGGVYGASHRIPLVGFLIAAIFAMGWWHFRTEPSVPLQWVSLGLGVIAIFFAIVAGIGLILIVLESLLPRRARRRGK